MTESNDAPAADDEREALFDQTNGVVGAESDSEQTTNIDRAAQKARGAVLGTAGAAGFGR